MRQKRLTQEPAGDCFLVEVLLEDSREIKINFSQKGTYQVSSLKQLTANSLQIK